MIKTALIPAAGLGNRMNDFTKDRPKCLLEVNGQPLLSMQINALEEAGFEHLIIITGYKSDMIEDYILHYSGKLNIKTVHNPLYDSTNNIYSVWLTNSFPELNDGFVLIESDLVFDTSVISLFKQPDLIALDDYDPVIHSGTVAILDKKDSVKALIMNGDIPLNQKIYKTVNITSFSSEAKILFFDYIAKYIQINEKNIYYESAIRDMIDIDSFTFKAADFSHIAWGEIDTPKDLKRVKSTFRPTKILN